MAESHDAGHGPLKFELKLVPTNRIVPVDRRPLDPKSIIPLKKAIERDGLKRPLDVARGHGMAINNFILLDGRHRLAVLKALGVDRVTVRIMSSEEGKTWRSSANLHHRNPNILERSENIAAYIASLPWVKPIRGGDQPHDKFIKRAATDLGYSRKMVGEALLHANLPDEIKDQVRGRPIANSRKELTKLAKLASKDEQLAHLSSLVKVPKIVMLKPPTIQDVPFATFSRTWKRSNLSKLFSGLSRIDQEAFVEKVLGVKSQRPPPDDFHDWT
jgi:ParB-like chromosome segregation protein Spo0J